MIELADEISALGLRTGIGDNQRDQTLLAGSSSSSRTLVLVIVVEYAETMNCEKASAFNMSPTVAISE